MNVRKTIMLAALLLVAATLPTTAQPPGCEVAVGTISAPGITVVNPEPSGACRTVDAGSLSATPLAECAVVLGRIDAPGVIVVPPAPPDACRDIDAGSLTAIGVSVCTVTVSEITGTPEVIVVEPGGGTGPGPVGPGSYCLEGNEFELKVPIAPLTAGIQVQYRWYRDGVPVTTTQTLPSNEDTIRYTVPEDEAYGDGGVVFHFMYTLLSDDCDAWTMSDEYTLHFWVPSITCRDVDPGSLSGLNVSTCAVTVGRIAAASEIIVVEPRAIASWPQAGG